VSRACTQFGVRDGAAARFVYGAAARFRNVGDSAVSGSRPEKRPVPTDRRTFCACIVSLNT
jgi:hypothetical protein